MGQDQSTVTSAGGYDYHLTQSGSPTDFVFTLGHTSQSQSCKHDTGTWRAADGTSGATYENLGNETKNSRANLSGRVQNGSVYYTGIDVYQTKNTSTNNTGSGFALGSTTSFHTVGSTQTTETRGGHSGSWYGSKLELGNSITSYTTVSGTMGQPFSGMTQTGFKTTTLYGTAAQTGISGMYGYGQTGTGGSYNTLPASPTVAPPGPYDMPTFLGEPNYKEVGGGGIEVGTSNAIIGKRVGYPENAIYSSDDLIQCRFQDIGERAAKASSAIMGLDKYDKETDKYNKNIYISFFQKDEITWYSRLVIFPQGFIDAGIGQKPSDVIRLLKQELKGNKLRNITIDAHSGPGQIIIGESSYFYSDLIDFKTNDYKKRMRNPLHRI